jgi:hypothetical protein
MPTINMKQPTATADRPVNILFMYRNRRLIIPFHNPTAAK